MQTYSHCTKYDLGRNIEDWNFMSIRPHVYARTLKFTKVARKGMF